MISKQMLSNGQDRIKTDLSRICTKVIHIENQIRKGVRTGWNGREQGCIWVGQSFIYSMFSAKHRRTNCNFSDSASLQSDILPQVITPNDNPPLDEFVRHVKDSGYEEGKILHTARHNALH